MKIALVAWLNKGEKDKLGSALFVCIGGLKFMLKKLSSNNCVPETALGGWVV